jgi:ABC-type transporter Mla subunit MlaD
VIARAGALLVVALVVVAGVIAFGDDPYRVSVPLENASGLRDGAAVKVSGLDRGTVKVRIDDRDRVILDLELDDEVGAVGKDAKVAIVAANFLGIKRVELNPGDVSDPAPDGHMLSPRQVTTPTDLDQVLSVFDADTRTRAKILLNEAGAAVVGRKVDVATLLKELPVGMEQAGPVLQELATNDATMKDLVERSDRFVADITSERRTLTQLLDTVGKTAETVSARRAELRETLARAPGTLRALRGFLGDLEAATVDLGPAAREITAAAPALAETLGEVEGFRKAAAPTLRTGTRVAPQLTRLATRSTPVLRRARTTVGSARTLATALPPVTDTLDKSSDNIIAVLENWSRAIQFRDQLGHVFRGEASVSPDLILTMVDRLAANQKRKAPARKAPKAPARAEAPSTPAATPARPPAVRLPKVPNLKETLDALPVKPTVDDVTEALEGLLGGLAGDKGGDGRAPDNDLLDFLLAP